MNKDLSVVVVVVAVAVEVPVVILVTAFGRTTNPSVERSKALPTVVESMIEIAAVVIFILSMYSFRLVRRDESRPPVMWSVRLPPQS